MNFDDVLNVTAGDIADFQPLPEGFYVVEITEMPEIDENWTSRAGNSGIKITFKLNVVGIHDVPDDMLEEFSGDPLKAKMTYWLYIVTRDEDTLEAGRRNLKEFLKSFGVVSDDSTSLNEAFANLPGQQALARVAHTVDDKDPSRVFANIDRFSPID